MTQLSKQGRDMDCDVVVDCSAGDSSKGKVTHALLATEKYSHVLRWGGGQNCGHTIYHQGKCFITHAIPAGVFYNIRSIIGPGCVVHPRSLLEEIEYLTKEGIDCSGVKVAYNATIVTDEHIAEEADESKIGTTRKGIGPAYRDKYARIAKQAHQIPELKPFLVDIYEEFYNSPNEVRILAEGAQGFYLDPHWGDYPYVTSSHCTVAGVILNGIPHTAIRKVYGVCKAYDTYVGSKPFQPEGEIFNQLREVGQEYGATTGRPRQCNFLDVKALEKAVRVNGVTDLIVNKMDILQQLNCWKVKGSTGETFDLKSEKAFKAFIVGHVPIEVEVRFSYSPERI